jgi:hypothetical protein
MSVSEWFRQAANGDPDPPTTATADDEEATVAGLNFLSAIDAHMKWKTRLESHINESRTEDLQTEAVSRDDDCPLGRWIYGIGAERFGKFDAFGDMKAEHAHFHACAGRVLAASRQGRKQDALEMLERGDYARASRQVKVLLARLYVQIAEGKGPE